MREIDLEKELFKDVETPIFMKHWQRQKFIKEHIREATLQKLHYMRISLNHEYHTDYNTFLEKQDSESVNILKKKWGIISVFPPRLSYDQYNGIVFSLDYYRTNYKPKEDTISEVVAIDKTKTRIVAYLIGKEPFVIIKIPQILLNWYRKKDGQRDRLDILLHDLENYHSYKTGKFSINELMSHRKQTRQSIRASLKRAAQIIYNKTLTHDEIRDLPSLETYKPCDTCAENDTCKTPCDKLKKRVPREISLLKRDTRYGTIDDFETQESERLRRSKGPKDPWDKTRNPLLIPTEAKKGMCDFIDKLDLSDPDHAEKLRNLTKKLIQKTPKDKLNSIFSSY